MMYFAKILCVLMNRGKPQHDDVIITSTLSSWGGHKAEPISIDYFKSIIETAMNALGRHSRTARPRCKQQYFSRQVRCQKEGIQM